MSDGVAHTHSLHINFTVQVGQPASDVDCWLNVVYSVYLTRSGLYSSALYTKNTHAVYDKCVLSRVRYSKIVSRSE